MTLDEDKSSSTNSTRANITDEIKLFRAFNTQQEYLYLTALLN